MKKVVMTGTRGIPAVMGGVETHCEVRDLPLWAWILLWSVAVHTCLMAFHHGMELS